MGRSVAGWWARCVGVAVVAALSLVVLAVPATSTGDVSAPTLAALSVSPGGADVTSTSATFSVVLRVTDDLSGIDVVDGSVSSPRGSFAMLLTRSGGSGTDATYDGTFTVDQRALPGRYRLFVYLTDRVGNVRTYDSEGLAALGLALGVDITGPQGDVTAPSVTGLQFTPATVDVRTGVATAAIELTVTDDEGADWVSAFVATPQGTTGGVGGINLQLVPGTTRAGTWRGTFSFPMHTRSGQWRISVRALDRVRNRVDLSATQLAGAGLQHSFEVLSDEDAEGPVISEVSVEPTEVNVHDADQTVRLRLRVTDPGTGVAVWAPGRTDVQMYLFNPFSFQGAFDLVEPHLVSGNALDGVYEAEVVVPRLSATGPRWIRVFARDAVANDRRVDPARAPGGAVVALSVYDRPKAPTVTGAEPADGAVTVRWDPPTDDGGSPVTGYVARESPAGVVVEAPATRSAMVGGLANGTEHTFTVTAVNKAGPSAPSPAVAATPRSAAPAATVPPLVVPLPVLSPVAPPPTAPASSGYWMVDSSGKVHAFGDVAHLGDARIGSTPAVDIEPTPSRRGYWVVDAAGHLFAFGDAAHLGAPTGLASGETVTSLSATPGGRGYWVFTSRGRALAFGDAPFLGDMAGARLNGAVLDSVPTPSGRGYYMVAADGGVFCFGDARFVGSMGGARLNAAVQSLVPAAGGGYWLVASDGGVFAFGAPFVGSMGSTRLNRPISGMVGSPSGRGYLMVAEDGGIFAFGDVAFRGSLGAAPPPSPVAAVAAV